MYAIRVKKSQLKKASTDVSKRTIFETREEAQAAMAESWEEVVELDD
jgi:hypothetical protein